MNLPDFGSDLRAFVAANVPGLVSGQNLFRGSYPQDRVDGVLLVESGGQRSNRPHGYVALNLQVTARAQNYSTANSWSRALYNLLNEPASTRTMGASKVIYSKALQPPFLIGQDERQAFRIVFNVEFHVVV